MKPAINSDFEFQFSCAPIWAGTSLVAGNKYVARVCQPGKGWMIDTNGNKHWFSVAGFSEDFTDADAIQAAMKHIQYSEIWPWNTVSAFTSQTKYNITQMGA